MKSKFHFRNGWFICAKATPENLRLFFGPRIAHPALKPLLLAECRRAETAGERFPITGEYHLAELVLGPKLHSLVFNRQKIRELFDVIPLGVEQLNGDPVTVHESGSDGLLTAGNASRVLGLRNELPAFERECGVQH